MLVLSGGVSPNCARDGINRPFIIRSKSLSYAYTCVLLVNLILAHLLALDMAAIQERCWRTGCDKIVCMDVWNNNFHICGIPVMPLLKWEVVLLSIVSRILLLWDHLLHGVCNFYNSKHPLIYPKVSGLGRISIFSPWFWLLGIRSGVYYLIPSCVT